MTRPPSSKRPSSKRPSSKRPKRSVPPNVLALATLPSLGITSAQLLIDVGIKDEAALRAMGPEACFRSLRFHFGRRVSTNFIYALECAIRGIGWKMLEPARKTALRVAAQRIVHDLEAGQGEAPL
jgi:TfoX C-terminal domain